MDAQSGLDGEISGGGLPGVEEAVLLTRDVWGEAAMAQLDGPSYEFFEPLLPPMRYVNTTFRHCPIVLGAPGALCKARYVSNGSGINLSAEGAHGWKDVGFPVTFRVGVREALYGAFVERLDGPRYVAGYLPIVQSAYKEGGCVYAQEVFVSTDPDLAHFGVVFVKFSLLEGDTGALTVHVRWNGVKQFSSGGLQDDQGRMLIGIDGHWRWDGEWNFLKTTITPDRPAYMAVFTEPTKNPIDLTSEGYEKQRQMCCTTWESLLSQGMTVDVPELRVNQVWRGLVVGNYQLLRDDQLCYSAHNQYEKLYIAEGGDAIRSLMLWGHLEDAKRMISPLLDYTRKGLEYHQAGFKLQLLAHYYWVTRDADFIRTQHPRWAAEILRILEHREADSGLFPRERYCGDVPTFVYSLNSNANGWRGLRDAGAMLMALGEQAEGARLLDIAAAFREKILAAVEESEEHTGDALFVPVALFGEEHGYEALTDNKAGSYWNLMAPYILDSRIFGKGPDRELGMLNYLHGHGGIFMGMIRVRPNMEFWVNKSNVNDLYGLRYTMALLRKDMVDRALVSFYGKLAHGMTRDTYLDGEASCLVPMDEFGRQVFLPPNSTSNAYFLWMLRYLLVQDWDMDDDGVPDTLRLMFATPRRWLANGETLRIVDAPTAFGKLSVCMTSHLHKGVVHAKIDAPRYVPKQTLLRARLPDGWRVMGAVVAGVRLPVDADGTVDVTGHTGHFDVAFEVRKK